MSTTRLSSLLESAIGIYGEMERGRLYSLGRVLPASILPSKLSQLTGIRDKMQTVATDTENQLARQICDNFANAKVAVETEEKTQTITSNDHKSKLEIIACILKVCAEFELGNVTLKNADSKLASLKSEFLQEFMTSDFHQQAVEFVLRKEIMNAHAAITDQDNLLTCRDEEINRLRRTTSRPTPRVEPTAVKSNSRPAIINQATQTFSPPVKISAPSMWSTMFNVVNNSTLTMPIPIPQQRSNRMKFGNGDNDE